ncbi:THO complex subunit 4D isoform X2 [Populus trichocarpa]|uniref:THO complex subunit 4D isoform X2 n=1 Tax=Populus trichocarpa TaxID=3694 RepID=UPI000D18781E|nr:THO complex subunit 4D isoform X2 [Populus trichocarpa]|eukprot:XP_024455756.1 THO complex subunit 4D isoform X2 [Populus trichocarpa]
MEWILLLCLEFVRCEIPSLLVHGVFAKEFLRLTSELELSPISKHWFLHAPSRRIRSLPWQHDLLEDSIRAAGITGLEVGTKLYVSNLDYGVTNEDIRELFAEIGDLKRFAVHYDKNGRSTGSAEVMYTRRSDAFSALKKYNNVLLDGRPMKIEIVGANPEVPISARVNVTGANGKKKRTVVMMPGPGRGRGGVVNNHGSGQSRRGGGGPRNGMRNGRGRGRAQGQGRGRGRGKKQPAEKSVDDLDKELESYHAEAMQT